MDMIAQFVMNQMSVLLNVKMKDLLPVGTLPVLLQKKSVQNFIVRMVTSKIVLVTVIAVRKSGLEMVLLIVPIKPMDVISPALTVMVVTVLILIVLHVKMMVR
jgi:hypothetical protein